MLLLYFPFTGSMQGFCAAIDGFKQCMVSELVVDGEQPYERQAMSVLVQYFSTVHDEHCQREGMLLTIQLNYS